MRVVAVMVSLLLFVGVVGAASPDGLPDSPLATYRVEAAEVHIAVSAFDKRNRPVTTLSVADFTLLRDGSPVGETVALEHRNDAPIVAAVMTDISDSMIKAVPIARDSWKWLDTNLLRSSDQVSYFDFGAELSAADSHKQQGVHSTSFYDCLIKVIPQIKSDGRSRRAIILFTDGYDNYSMTSLNDVITLAVEQDIAVYAITTLKFKIKYDEQALDYLTSSTGGRYFVIKDSKGMTAALQEITQELRNGFEVAFPVGKCSNGMHHIALRPANRNLHFYYRAAYYQENSTGIQPLLLASER